MKTVKDIAFYLKERTKDEWDSLIIIDSGGFKGNGKTTLSIELCEEICKLNDYPYEMEKLLMLDATEEKVRELIKTLPKGIPIHIDEGIMIAYKRDYNEKSNKGLVKFINICRKFGHPIIFNVPNFWDLDKDIRNLCDFRIIIPKRGIACLLHKDINSEYEDLWWRDENKEMLDKEIGSDRADLNALVRGWEKCKHHIFSVLFKKLPQEQYEKYRKMSMEQEGKQLEFSEKRVLVLARLMTWLLVNKGYTQSSLTDKINSTIAKSNYSGQYDKYKVSLETINKYLDSWKKEGSSNAS